MSMTEQELPFVAVGAPAYSRAKAWSYTLFIVFLYLVNWADKALIGLVAQPLAHELHLTASQIGMVGSGFFIAFTIGGFFAGYLNKLFGLKSIMALLAVSWAVFILPVVAVPTFLVLLVGRMGLGFTEGPSGALVYTAIYSWHPPEKRGIPSAWISACSSMSKFLAAPLLTLVIVTYGWRAAFETLAGLSILWCLIWLLVWREGPYGTAHQSAPDVQSEVEASVPWSRLFRSPTFIGASVAVLSMYSIMAAALTWLPSYFEVGLGYTRLQAGTFYGFPGLVAVVTMFGSASFGDWMVSRGGTTRVYRGFAVGIGLLCGGLCFAALPYVTSPAVAVALTSLGYGLGSIAVPLASACVSQICPRQQLSGTLGLYFAIMATGGIFAPYITGLIVDAAASASCGYSEAFQVFGVAAVGASIAALVMINPERDAARMKAVAAQSNPLT